jgi:hypothetical protein
MDEQIRLFVGDQCLLHLGNISDRFLPDFPEISTVYLTRNCVVQVRMNVPNVNGEGSPPSIDASKGNPVTVPVLDHGTVRADRTGTTLGAEAKSEDEQPPPLRRVSGRLPAPRSAKPLGAISLDSKSGLCRPVRDRWEYVPVTSSIPKQHGSSDAGHTSMLFASDLSHRGTESLVPFVESVPDVILGPAGGGD